MALFDKYYIPDNIPVSWLERDYRLSADDLFLVSTPNRETETEYMSKYIRMDDLSSQMLCSVFERITEIEEQDGHTGWLRADTNPPYILCALHETNDGLDSAMAYPLSTGMIEVFNTTEIPYIHVHDLSADNLSAGNAIISNLTVLVSADIPIPPATSDTIGGIKIWTGTLVQYNAIATKDSDTLYFVHG